MNSTICCKLEKYITEEFSDAALYKALAAVTRVDVEKKRLLRIAEEEECHAKVFQKIYRESCGKPYCPVIPPITEEGCYTDILLDKVYDELEEYRKYAEDYICETVNGELKRAYFCAMVDENAHAAILQRILLGRGTSRCRGGE